jgi:hypothetical protein
MYTRKLTTKTRKGKKTMGKRVGKSVNKNRNNRNNNRRTKRAGNLLKYAANSVNPNLGLVSAANLATKGALLGASNVWAGYEILKILKNPRLTNDEKFNKSVAILRKAFNKNANFGKEAVKTFVDTDKVKSDANKFVNRQKAAFTGNLAPISQPALLHERPPVYPPVRQQIRQNKPIRQYSRNTHGFPSMLHENLSR